jgi:hypothetical protein
MLRKSSDVGNGRTSSDSRATDLLKTLLAVDTFFAYNLQGFEPLACPKSELPSQITNLIETLDRL